MQIRKSSRLSRTWLRLQRQWQVEDTIWNDNTINQKLHLCSYTEKKDSLILLISIGGAIGFRVNRFLGARRSTFKSSLPTTKPLQSTKWMAHMNLSWAHTAEHLRTPNIHVEPRVTSRGEDKGGEKNDQKEGQKPQRVKGEKGNTGVESTSDTHTHNATETMFRLSSRTETLQGEGFGEAGCANDLTGLIGACSKYEGCDGQSRNVIYIKIQPQLRTQLLRFLLL